MSGWVHVVGKADCCILLVAESSGDESRLFDIACWKCKLFRSNCSYACVSKCQILQSVIVQPGPLSEPLTLKSSAYSLSFPNSRFGKLKFCGWLAASPTLGTISFSFGRLEDAITAQYIASHLDEPRWHLRHFKGSENVIRTDFHTMAAVVKMGLSFWLFLGQIQSSNHRTKTPRLVEHWITSDQWPPLPVWSVLILRISAPEAADHSRTRWSGCYSPTTHTDAHTTHTDTHIHMHHEATLARDDLSYVVQGTAPLWRLALLDALVPLLASFPATGPLHIIMANTVMYWTTWGHRELNIAEKELLSFLSINEAHTSCGIRKTFIRVLM